jgi:hypothetical protein
MKQIDQYKLSGEFRRLAELCEKQEMTYFNLTTALTSRGHALLTMLLSVPFLQPIPLPGLSILFGVIIAFAGIAMAANKKPWLPKSWLQKKVSPKLMNKIFLSSAKVVRYLEKFIRPRGGFIANNLWLRRCIGVMIACCGILLSLPLPPGTNLPPALTITCLSMAILELDGLLMTLGIIIFILNLFFFSALGVLGVDSLQRLVHHYAHIFG